MRLDTTKPLTVLRGFACVVALMLGSTLRAQGPQQTAQPPRGEDTVPSAPTVDTPIPKTGAEADTPPERVLDLSNPRAAMQEFLVAVQDSLGDRPDRIDDAVACMDTSGLIGEDRIERARKLARRLHDLIDRQGVKLDDIPADQDGPTYLFFRPVESDKPGPEIQIGRDRVTDLWRFTAFTLESIPALEAAAKAKNAGAAEAKVVASEVPAARRSARATFATFLKAMNSDPPNLKDAVLCLDPTGQDPNAWQVHGPDLATKLKNVMDKLKVVVLAEIPEDPKGPPYFWYESKIGNIVLARIEGEKSENAKDKKTLNGEWRFTPQTLKTLDAVYREFEERPIVPELRQAGIEEHLTLVMRIQKMLPDWLRAEFWHLQGWQWVVLVALLPIGWLIKILASAVTALVLGAWLRHRKLKVDRDVRRRAFRTTGAVVTALFWLYAVKEMQLSEEALGVLLPATKLILTLTTVWVGYRLVDILGGHIAANSDLQLTRFDDVLIPMLQKILRFLVLVVVAVFALEWMGHEWTTLLGALGIGGLALAFAAQDTLGNFFGSIAVLFDRPFGIGDWVVIGDVEGTVERVGFRSTRIRTFYNSMITVPNSKLAVTSVDNYGARRYRRAKILLSLTYSTPPERIDAFCEGIRELIRLHPYTRKDYYHVYFNKFGASSLDVLLYAFFEVPDWSTELRERHKLFIDILRLAERLGVEFAFPTQTIWMERSRPAPERLDADSIAQSPGDPDVVGFGEAARLFEDTHGPDPTPPGPVVIDRIPRSKRSKN